jgi:hypothetical protein
VDAKITPLRPSPAKAPRPKDGTNAEHQRRYGEKRKSAATVTAVTPQRNAAPPARSLTGITLAAALGLATARVGGLR